MSRHPAVVFTISLVVVYFSLIVGYCIWLLTEIDPQISDYWTMVPTIGAYIVLVAALLNKAIGKQLWWKILFAVMCLEFLNWNLLLPKLSIPRLGNTDWSLEGVAMDLLASLPVMVIVYLYAFRSKQLWDTEDEGGI